MLRILGVALALVVSPPASAQFFDGNDLHAMCGSDDRAPVIAYSMGALDAAFMYQKLSGVRDRICMQDGIEASQVADVVCNYLDDRPGDRHWLGADLVAESAAAAWPCE